MKIEEKTGRTDRALEYKLRNEIRALNGIKDGISKLTKLLTPLAAVVTARDVYNDVTYWNEMQSYADHGHPTKLDLEDETKAEIARQLMRDVRLAQGIYVEDAVSSVSFLILGLVDVGAVIGALIPGTQPLSLAVLAIDGGLKMFMLTVSVTNVALTIVADETRAAVKSADKKLHGARTHGFVMDSIGTPLKGVTV